MSEKHQRYELARQSRDVRFDGRFFVGVKTTGIFCRPVCPVTLPKPENVTFFDSAAAASESGFRPCLRCRPEAAPGTPAWRGTETTVSRGLKLIEEGALERGSVSTLAERLGVTTRHLSRLFHEHAGASPLTFARTRRLLLAKKLIDETRMNMTDVALASGYRSVRRFNDHFQQVYNRSPTQLRSLNTQRHERGQGADGICLSLAYRSPFDWPHMLRFLSTRAIPGVEAVMDGKYQRTFNFSGTPGLISIGHVPGSDKLDISVSGGKPQDVLTCLKQSRRLFDLFCDPVEIQQAFSGESQMARLISNCEGIRVPGAWDGYEIAVRALVGQQISVSGATTIMGRIAGRYGEQNCAGPDTSGASVPHLVFPTPERVMMLDPADLPMPRIRAEAIKTLSSAIAAGDIQFGEFVDGETLVARLQEIRGIGPWTAQYIAMRVLGDPDAFLTGDLVLLKAARLYFDEPDMTQAMLLGYSESWRPWRAYICMALWRYAGDYKGQLTGEKK